MDQQYGQGRRGDELPEELRDRSALLAWLQQAKNTLDPKAAEERQAQEEVIQKRRDEEELRGKKKPGRKPAAPD